MMKKRAKLEMETLGKILLLTAFLIIFLLMFKGCKDQMTNVGRVGLNEYVCWFSHALKADLTFLFPSGCQTIDVEKPQTETDMARLMRACWWMHGQGDKDITTGESLAGILAQRSIWWYDIARTCYVFTPDKDVPVTNLENYLRRRDKSGKEVEKDSKATAWYYIQKTGREEIGICLDSREEKLQKGKKYFIIFYDDRSPISQGVRDRILISRDPNFGEKEVGFISWSGNLLKSGIKTLEQFLGMKLNPWDNNACYLWEDMIRKTETALEEKRLEEKATEIFDEVSDKFRECYETEPKENCMCDDSEMSLESLPQGYEIKVEKVSADEYNMVLYNKKNEWVIGESFSTKIGAINKAESDLKKGVNLPDTDILCSEGLGLADSLTLPKAHFSLIHNLDSRYYLQPFTKDITPCSTTLQTYTTKYHGIYIFAYSYDTSSRKWYIPDKTPVLKYCSSGEPVTEKAKEGIEKKAKEEERRVKEEEKAIEVFDEISDKFQACYETEITESCMCDDSEINLTQLPQSYEIRIEKKDINKYSLVLYEKGKKDIIKEESLDVNVGSWSKAKQDIESKTLYAGIVLQNLCKEGLGLDVSVPLNSYTPPFSLIYNADSRFYLNPPISRSIIPPQAMITLCPDIQYEPFGSYEGMYIFSQSFDVKNRKFYLDPYKMPVLRYCSGSPVSKEAEEKLKKAEGMKLEAVKLFDEVSSKFKSCFETEIIESCMCDDSEISLEHLPRSYEIRVKKEAASQYTLILYNKNKEEVIKEKGFNVNVGFWSKAKQDVEEKSLYAMNISQTALCTGGLGLEDSFSLSSSFPPFLLFRNADSRFYLNPPVSKAVLPPQDMITPCAGVQYGPFGSYEGMYIFSQSFDVKNRKFYLDPYKMPVLRYCSGSPVSKEAEEEIERREKEEQKSLCESYNKDECYSHTDKCYPNLLESGAFVSCIYCSDSFKCNEILSKEICGLNPCSKTCKWETIPGLLKGACQSV